ncbi:uncharacterized protein si:dkey-79d12.4 [Xyrauchen texanus]|uniref:uncharacterized protein si:dkey-79d12.4 n=1 Tax=Xyrauchen texanus TaxID=154827 RepID=UPI002241B52A|nr:uncharacterized protein si:dkey-79d12.4 [Xyrauchen texanus]XP_052003042.1 uncharacterized protein si:dkey-79d12.4 [Xyrauchen texanus]XP_052003043.1 uncharacterized protein si:dkey-79d12.4 [Xyrauchen texanus]
MSLAVISEDNCVCGENTENTLLCNICGVLFKCTWHLNEHLEKHLQEIMHKPQVKEDMEPAEFKSVVKMEETKKIRMKETISKNDMSTGFLLDHTYCAALHHIVPLRLKAGDHTYSGIGNCINNYTNIINQSSKLANIKMETRPDSLPVSAQQSKANIFMLQLRSQKGEKSGSSNLSKMDVKVENDNMDCLVECGLNEEMVVDRKFYSEDEESTETSNDEDSDSLPAGDTEYSPDEDLSSDSQYSTCTDTDKSRRKRSHANLNLDPASLVSTVQAGFQADSLISVKTQMEDCQNKATFVCCLCQVVCENKDALLKHIDKDHPAAMFICAHCLNIFSKEDAFRYHVCSRPTGYLSILPTTPVTQVPVVPLSDPANQHSTNYSSQRLIPTPILGTNCNIIKMITLPKTFDKVSKTPFPNQCDPPLSSTPSKSTNTHTSPQISQFHNNTNTFNQRPHLPNIKTENKRLPLDSLPESEANIFTHHPGTWRGENIGSSIMSNQQVKVENDKEYGLLECGPNEEEVVEEEYEITEDEESTRTNNEEDSDSLPVGDTEYSPDEDLSSDSQYSTGTNNDESIRKRSLANYSMDPESLTSRGKVGFRADSLVSMETHMEDYKNKATFACCLCQVICENKDLLLKHIAKDHPAAMFICAHCLNIFSKEDTFRYHVCRRPTGNMSILPSTPVSQVPVVPLSDPEKQCSINRSSQRLIPTPILGTTCNTIKMIALPKTFDKVSKTPLPNQCSPPLSSTPSKSTNAHSSQQILQFHNYTNTFNQGSLLPNIKTENKRLPLDSLPESEANIFTHHPGTWKGENIGSSIMSSQQVNVENDKEYGLLECGPNEEEVVEEEYEITEDEESTLTNNKEDSDSLPVGDKEYSPGEDLSSDSQYSTGTNNDDSIRKRSLANYSMDPESLTSSGKVGFRADSLISMETHMEDCKNKATFACCLCQVICENKDLLLKHIAKDHPAAMFICAHCLNIFSKEDTFRYHVCRRPTGNMSILPSTPVSQVPVVPLSDPEKQRSINLSSQRLIPTPILGTTCNTIKMITLPKSFDKVSKTTLPNQCSPPLSSTPSKSTNAHSSQQILQFHNYTNTFNQGSLLPNIKTENKRLPLDSLPESDANIITHHLGTWRGEKSGSFIMSNKHVKVENDNEDGLVECGPYEEVVGDGEFKMTTYKERTKSSNEADSVTLPPGNTVYHAGKDLSLNSQYSTGSNNDESIKKIFHANYRMNPEIFTSTAKVHFQADSSICCNGKSVNMEKHMKDCKTNPTFACSLCQVVCENEGLLLKHTAEDHPSAIFICAHCLNMFSKEDTFRNHVCSRLTGYTNSLPATPVTPVPVVPSVCLSDPAKQLSTKRTPPCAPILGTNCTTIKMINSTKTFNKVSMTPLSNQSGPRLSLNTLTSTNAHSTQISEVVLPIKPVAKLSQTVDQTKMVLLQTTALTQANIVREISPLSPAKLNPQGVAVPQSLFRPPCPRGSFVVCPNVPVCAPSVVHQTNPSLSNQSRMTLRIPTPSSPSFPTKVFLSFSPTVNFSAPILVQANRNKPRLALKQIPAANDRPLQLPAKAPLATPVSCPTLLRTIVQNNQPQIPLKTSSRQIQIPTPAPLEIVAMFLNQSKDLPLQKRFQQSWRSKTIFPCRQCGAISRQLSLRVRHRYLHQGSRLYRCQCGKSFQRQLHLLRHQVQHAESVRFVCARCGNTFDGAHKLTLHKQRLHRKHKTSNCRQYAKKQCTAAFDCICGQEFVRPSALLWHMLKNAKPLKHKHKNDSGLH